MTISKPGRNCYQQYDFGDAASTKLNFLNNFFSSIPLRLAPRSRSHTEKCSGFLLKQQTYQLARLRNRPIRASSSLTNTHTLHSIFGPPPTSLSCRETRAKLTGNIALLRSLVGRNTGEITKFIFFKRSELLQLCSNILQLIVEKTT